MYQFQLQSISYMNLPSNVAKLVLKLKGPFPKFLYEQFD